MKKRRIAGFLILAVLLLTGFAFASTVTLDPEKNRIFQDASISEMLDTLSTNEPLAKEQYDNQYLAIVGQIGEISGNGKTVTLISSANETSGKRSIRCTFQEESLRAQVLTFSTGDTVRVYGLTVISVLPSKSYSVIGRGIEKSTAASSASPRFRFLYGQPDTEPKEERSFDKDISLMIPRRWVAVETVTKEYHLYRLNELSDSKKAEPEQLYLLYFDNEKYLATMDDRFRTTEIERAIIKNILPKEKIGFGRFPKQRDVYGKTFQYYDTAYGNYHAEFAFAPNGEKGIFCMLYIYETSDHVDDILMLMRQLAT